MNIRYPIYEGVYRILTSHMGMEHAESGNAPLFPWRLPRQDTDGP